MSATPATKGKTCIDSNLILWSNAEIKTLTTNIHHRITDNKYNTRHEIIQLSLYTYLCVCAV